MSLPDLRSSPGFGDDPEPPRGAPAARGLAATPVTEALLALNAAVFAMEATLARSLVDIPSRLALELGASYPLATIGEHRWETIVTACFLHGGLFHVGFNMLVLWLTGPLAEKAVGPARMATTYLVAGASGNALSVAAGFLMRRGGTLNWGASGAICGVIMATFVIGVRSQGWRGPLTSTMASWLVFIVVVGALSMVGASSRVDNFAHLGGALAGGVLGLLWQPTVRTSARTNGVVLGGCAAVLLASLAVVAVHDRTDPFATLMLRERSDYTHDAVNDGRCGDAQAGLAAVERLRERMAPVTSLRDMVEGTCGHAGDR